MLSILLVLVSSLPLSFRRSQRDQFTQPSSPPSEGGKREVRSKKGSFSKKVPFTGREASLRLSLRMKGGSVANEEKFLQLIIHFCCS